VIVGLASLDGSRLHIGAGRLFFTSSSHSCLVFFIPVFTAYQGWGVLLLFRSERSYTYYLLFVCGTSSFCRRKCIVSSAVFLHLLAYHKILHASFFCCQFRCMLMRGYIYRSGDDWFSSSFQSCCFAFFTYVLFKRRVGSVFGFAFCFFFRA